MPRYFFLLRDPIDRLPKPHIDSKEAGTMERDSISEGRNKNPLRPGGWTFCGSRGGLKSEGNGPTSSEIGP